MMSLDFQAEKSKRRANRAEQESVSGLGWKGISRTAFPSGSLESDTLLDPVLFFVGNRRWIPVHPENYQIMGGPIIQRQDL